MQETKKIGIRRVPEIPRIVVAERSSKWRDLLERVRDAKDGQVFEVELHGQGRARSVYATLHAARKRYGMQDQVHVVLRAGRVFVGRARRR